MLTFCAVAQRFAAIEQLSARNQIIVELAELFKAVDANEAKSVAYLVCGDLGPKHKNITFGLAEKQLQASVRQFFVMSNPDEFDVLARSTGDLGEAFAQLQQRLAGVNAACGQTCAFGSTMTMQEVFAALRQLAKVNGNGAVLAKQDALMRILQQLCPLGSKFVLRMILDKLRLGFSEMTILSALSWFLVQSKKVQDDLEQAFNVCSDIGQIAHVCKTYGLDGIGQITPSLGTPIRPAAAERMESVVAIVEKLGNCVAQPKLDGLRIQVHKSGNDVWLFSRNLLETTAMFPELVAAVRQLPAQNFIAEGEAIAFDAENNQFLSFQVTTTRRRKHTVTDAANEVPLRIFLFDMLYLNDQSLLGQPHAERRQKLEILCVGHDKTATIQVIAERAFSADTATNALNLEAYFEEQVDLGLEGLIAKRPDAVYQAGKRNFNWIKLKRLENSALQDTIDCVIMGYYLGRGKRASFGLGALLVGVYDADNDVFETVCKIGTGLSDADLALYKERCDQLATGERPKNFNVAKDLQPNVWVMPQLVVTVRADQISKSPLHTACQSKLGYGLALRFPRLVDLRLDKAATEATTTEELIRLEAMQKKI